MDQPSFPPSTAPQTTHSDEAAVTGTQRPAEAPLPAAQHTVPWKTKQPVERVSHIRILPTSLPWVHEQIMEQRERQQAQPQEGDSAPSSVDTSLDSPDTLSERTPEQQAATARSLKPHARSVVDLEKLRLEPPESFGQSSGPPKKSRKWQFGIRSRNEPHEAMLCLYKAIAAQGGVWEIIPAGSGKSTFFSGTGLGSDNFLHRRRRQLYSAFRPAQTIAK